MTVEAGKLRYNPSTNNWEMYDGVNWRIVPEHDVKTAMPKWERWFAWRPVRDIHGNWQWCKTVYRRWQSDSKFPVMKYNRYEYGNAFDILRNEY